MKNEENLGSWKSVSKTCLQDISNLSTVFALGPSGVRLTFYDALKELCVATSGVLVRIKARVAATSTSAVAKCTSSVNANVFSESSPMEETSEVTTSEPISDTVNMFETLDQPMLYV